MASSIWSSRKVFSRFISAWVTERFNRRALCTGGTAAVIGDFDGRTGVDLVVDGGDLTSRPRLRFSPAWETEFPSPLDHSSPPRNVLSSGNRDLNGDAKPDLVVTSTLAPGRICCRSS